MMRAPVLLLALLLALPGAAMAQPADPRTEADRLMRVFVDDGIGGFLDTVFADTFIGQDQAARRSMQEARPRWEREIQNFGAMIDSVYAGERRFAPVVRTLCYVLRFRRAPLYVNFRYYQTPQGWNLINFGWHDNVQNWECAAGAPLVAP
jgi:hypothetical protein